MTKTKRSHEYHGLINSPEYSAWHGMKDRCLNSRRPNYHYYGGRGISICERWVKSFTGFLEDMGKKPSPAHMIERIDNDGDYEPSNCKWATPKEQMNNRRLRAHCKNGHPFEDNDTYIRASGSRNCKICRRKYDNRRYPLKKMRLAN